MHSRTWTSIITTVSLAMTLATASTVFGRMIIPGTRLPDNPFLVSTGGGGGGLPPEDPYQPPRQPVVTGPVNRTTTALTVRLTDRSSYEQGYELYRGLSATGPWTLIAALAPFTGMVDHTDSGLSPDTPYWYRVRAYNAYGESFATSFPAMSTLDGRSVWRVQLRLRTANVSDAGTDDSVRVELNGPNLTWLDYGRDDFERGTDYTYDLLLDGVRDLADINTIYIHKEGTDGWCIESLALLVNSKEANPVEIFHQDFGPTAATCRWVDRGDGHQEFVSVSRAMLRAHPLWQNFQQPPQQQALGILRDELESRIEGLVGDMLHGKDAYWGDLDGERYVEVSRKDDQAVHVTLDLVAEVPLTGNPEVDVSFDLRFVGSCTDGQTPLTLRIIPENIDAVADADWWEEVLTFWVSFVETGVAEAVEGAFAGIERVMELNPGMPVCITPLVANSGAVTLIPSFPPPPGGTLPPKTVGTRPVLFPAINTRFAQ